MDVIVKIFIAGIAFYILWAVAKPQWDFRIIVNRDSVKFQTGIPEGKRAALRRFFLKDLEPAQRIVISGRREKETGRLTMRIQGTDDPGLKQRIRNFLVTSL